jgi:hypothetical protein
VPTRVQLRRTKGWRKPSGVVVVSRPSRWGNPFTLEDGRDAAVGRFAAALSDRLAGALGPASPMQGYPEDDVIRAELVGRDLACWCPLDQPCHADVLLQVANE